MVPFFDVRDGLSVYNGIVSRGGGGEEWWSLSR